MIVQMRIVPPTVKLPLWRCTPYPSAADTGLSIVGSENAWVLLSYPFAIAVARVGTQPVDPGRPIALWSTVAAVPVHPDPGPTVVSHHARIESLPVSIRECRSPMCSPQLRWCWYHSPMVVVAKPILVLPPLLIRVVFSIGGIPSPHRGRTHHCRTVAANASGIDSSSRL